VRFTGGRTFSAPRAAVFDAIHDPTVLLACIPGCAAAERVSPTEYRARLALQVAAIGGSYELRVRVVDADRPAACRLEGRLDGRSGTITGRATIALAELDGEGDVAVTAGRGDDAGCRLAYVADARIEGPLAWLDTGLVERLAQRVLAQGLDRLADDLARRAVRAT
jgi:uncharacterized protein